MNTLQKLLTAGTLAVGLAGLYAGGITFTAAAETAQETVAQSETESAVQKVVTEYSELWTGTVTFRTGVPAQWLVRVPDDTEPKGCSATIKIPSLGWGTDTRSKEEGHLTLVQGDNLVYEFTPQEAGDFLFTCWMGSGCHSNYIHVTADGIPDSNAIKGINGHTESAHTEQTTSTISGTTAATAKVTTAAFGSAAAASAGASGPKTGEHSLAGMIALLFSFLGIVFVTGRRRKIT